MDRKIEVMVTGNQLIKDNDLAGVQGEANVTMLRICFGADWDGYAKTVTFWNAKGQNPVKRTLTADLLENMSKSMRVYLCPIPGEPLELAGRCSFIIDGYMNGKRMRSLDDTLKVRPAGMADHAGEPADPSPSQAEQIQAGIESLMSEVQKAVEAQAWAKQAENNKNVAARYMQQAQADATEAASHADASGQNARDAQAWANKAQAEAERATVPAVEGVYNVVLTDRETKEQWALIAENGALKLLGVDYPTSTTEPVMIDIATGAAYELIVEGGVLKLMEV